MGSQAERELASGGMAHDDDTIQVQVVALGDLPKKAIAVHNIFKRPRPPSALVADAAVFQIPSRQAFGS